VSIVLESISSPVFLLNMSDDFLVANAIIILYIPKQE